MRPPPDGGGDASRPDDPKAGAAFANSDGSSGGSWRAHLQLRFAALEQRTVLVERRHSGPLIVQKALYPEGERVCHAVIVHPPGGIAGGDQLALEVNIGQGAHALLTTPGAGKWYKANNRSAAQRLQFTLGAGAALEWLPQETILFDAAQVSMTTEVELQGDAKYAGWEILCFGRRAAGEKFERGSLRQRVQFRRDGELIWNELASLDAQDRAMTSQVGLNGRSVSAVFNIAAGATPVEVLEACRAVEPRSGCQFGVTALPEVFAARFLGDSAEHAREYFEALWKILRPWYAQVDMQRPRIWST